MKGMNLRLAITFFWIIGCGAGPEQTGTKGTTPGPDSDPDKGNDLERALAPFRSHYSPVSLEELEGVHVGVSGDESSFHHTTQFDRVYEGERERDFTSISVSQRQELQFAVFQGKCFAQVGYYTKFDATFGDSCYESSVRTQYSCVIRDDYIIDVVVEASAVLKDERHERFPDTNDPVVPEPVGKMQTFLIGRRGNQLGIYPVAPDLTFEWDNPCR